MKSQQLLKQPPPHLPISPGQHRDNMLVQSPNHFFQTFDKTFTTPVNCFSQFNESVSICVCMCLTYLQMEFQINEIAKQHGAMKMTSAKLSQSEVHCVNSRESLVWWGMYQTKNQETRVFLSHLRHKDNWSQSLSLRPKKEAMANHS